MRETGHGKAPTQLDVIISCSQAEVQVKVAQVKTQEYGCQETERVKD